MWTQNTEKPLFSSKFSVGYTLNFGLLEAPAHGREWVQCREIATSRFYTRSQSSSLPETHFLALGINNKKINPGEAICNTERAIYRIEERMGWIHKTYFSGTDCPDIYHVRVSPGWTQNYQAVSLFTLLLRAGLFFKSNDASNRSLWNDLMGFDYFRYSDGLKHAALRFINGNQHFAGQRRTDKGNYGIGWYGAFYESRFADASLYENAERLLIPRSRVEELSQEISRQQPNLDQSGCWLEACNRLAKRVF